MAEKFLRYRFQLQLQSVDDLRPNISHLQNDVRQLLLHQRYLERQMYLVNKQLNDNPTDKESETRRMLRRLGIFIFLCFTGL